MEKKTLHKLLLRIVLLVVLLVVMNFVYKMFFFEKDLQEHSAVINTVRALPDSTDIVYIGESSNITARGDDIDKRAISAFIADFFPNLKVSDITKEASHAGIYKTLLGNIPEDSEVKTVVVTLNMRSFNASWIFSELETPLRKSMVLLKDYPPLFKRFLLSFKAYDIKTAEEREQQFKKKWEKDVLHFPYDFPHKNVIEWDNRMATTGIRDSSGKRNQKKTELACHYIKTYAFIIDTLNNPRIKDFNEIIELARERKWNLVLNLLAENMEKAEKLVGKDLTFLMDKNRKILIEYFQKTRGIPIVDNLYAVEDEQFIDQDWTTEHYAEKGRKTIARNVALELRNFYPDEFKDIDYDKFARTSFFNDCEKRIIWSQMQTITDEKSYSGNYSSKTGKGDDFSITFEYPLQAIPDSSLNKVHAKMKLYQYSDKHDGTFVIQILGDKTAHFWKGNSIHDQVKKTQAWEDYQITFSIPDSLKKADIIKLYLYNTSKETILLDDFKVDFE